MNVFFGKISARKCLQSATQLESLKQEYYKVLSDIFTPEQIKKPFNKNKRVK